MFANRTQKTVTTPGGASVVIRKLSGRHLERAESEHALQLMEGVKRLGLAFQKEMAETFKAAPSADVKAVQADPLNGYDVQIVLERGIVSWSEPEKVTPENIADMDGTERTFLSHEIMRLTRPELFRTADEQAADEKNG